MSRPRRILVTGATGYIGGRLVPRLLQEDYSVRVLVRDLGRLPGRSWLDQVEVAEGDALKPQTLAQALQGTHSAYYFIHSLYGGRDFHRKDLLAARNFAAAAEGAEVGRIIYLSGLGDSQAELSEHLRSRQLTGAALRQSGVPVTEFRAAIIVGSGSASFEMIRYLTERIPVMISPRWVFSRIQPIAIQDVMEYLAGALETGESAGRIIEIGGEDVLTYAEMMLGYAKVRGLHRLIIPLPVLTPGLSSYWVHWVTPVSARIAHPLIEGLRNEVIVRDDSARRLFPQIEPIGYQAAVRLALADLQAGRVETAWTDALTRREHELPTVKVAEREGIIAKRWERVVDATGQAAFDLFARLGGQRGWLYVNWIWSLRGIADRLIGGAGLCRGRRHPELLRAGDVVDCWRVEALESGRLLRLRSELKAPGQLWLEFEARPGDDGKLILTQTLFYAPKGLWGFLYWYLFYPVHSIVFSGLMRKLAAQVETYSAQD